MLNQTLPLNTQLQGNQNILIKKEISSIITVNEKRLSTKKLSLRNIFPESEKDNPIVKKMKTELAALMNSGSKFNYFRKN